MFRDKIKDFCHIYEGKNWKHRVAQKFQYPSTRYSNKLATGAWDGGKAMGGEGSRRAVESDRTQ